IQPRKQTSGKPPKPQLLRKCALRVWEQFIDQPLWQGLGRVDQYELRSLVDLAVGDECSHTQSEAVHRSLPDGSDPLLPIHDPARLVRFRPLWINGNDQFARSRVIAERAVLRRLEPDAAVKSDNYGIWQEWVGRFDVVADARNVRDHLRTLVPCKLGLVVTAEA